MVDATPYRVVWCQLWHLLKGTHVALVIPANFANFILTITNTGAGLSSRNSVAFGFDLTAGLTQGDVGRIANLLRDGLTPMYDNAWILGPTHAVEGTGAAPLVWDDTGTEAGIAGASVYSPPSVSYVVSKRTNIGGRAFRGRMYLPGVQEGDVDEAGIIAGARVNTTQATLDALKVALLADPAIDQLVLFHDDTTPGALAPTTIQSYLVRNVVGNMRPRQRR